MAIPNWLLGRHLTTVTITPQTVAANGSLSDGTARTLTALVDNIELAIDPSHEEINPVNSTRANNVLIVDDSSISLSIIQVNNGSDPDFLGLIIQTSDVFKVIFTMGTATNSIQTWTGYFTRGAYRNGVQGRGKIIASLTLHQVDNSSSTLVRGIA